MTSKDTRIVEADDSFVYEDLENQTPINYDEEVLQLEMLIDDFPSHYSEWTNETRYMWLTTTLKGEEPVIRDQMQGMHTAEEDHRNLTEDEQELFVDENFSIMEEMMEIEDENSSIENLGLSISNDPENREEEHHADPVSILKTIEEVKVTTVDQIAEYELDPIKRQQLIEYAETLSPDDQLILLDTMKTLVGPTPQIVSMDKEIANIIEMATKSTLLKAKNVAAAERLTEFVKLSQQVSRMVHGSMKDDIVNSLKIDSTLEHVKKQNETISILSTAIYDLASKVGMTRYLEPENMPVNVENLLRVLLIIGHGAKGWAVAAEQGKALAVRNKQRIESLEEITKQANQRAEDMRIYRETQEAKERAGLLKSARYYHIMNYSGVYIGTERESDEEGKVTLTRRSIIFTHDPDKAVSIETIDDARALFDALHVWYNGFKDFRQRLKQANIRINTFFIGETTVRKVEG